MALQSTPHLRIVNRIPRYFIHDRDIHQHHRPPSGNLHIRNHWNPSWRQYTFRHTKNKTTYPVYDPPRHSLHSIFLRDNTLHVELYLHSMLNFTNRTRKNILFPKYQKRLSPPFYGKTLFFMTIPFRN